MEGGVWFRAAIGKRKNAEARWLLPMICRRGGITRAGHRRDPHSRHHHRIRNLGHGRGGFRRADQASGQGRQHPDRAADRRQADRAARRAAGIQAARRTDVRTRNAPQQAAGFLVAADRAAGRPAPAASRPAARMRDSRMPASRRTTTRRTASRKTGSRRTASKPDGFKPDGLKTKKPRDDKPAYVSKARRADPSAKSPGFKKKAKKFRS